MESPPSLSNVLDDETENQEDLVVLKELYKVKCTIRGEALVKFDFLMDSLNEKDESIEELEYHLNDKERRFNLLRQELKTERCISQGLKQQIETFELDKVKDLETIERAQLLAQELDASKKELEVAHDSLTRDLGHLVRANKLVKDELKKLGENHDLLQETYKKALGSMNDPIIDKNVASSSTSFTSEHAKLVEEHVRLQEELSLHVETNTYLESLVTKYGLNYHPNESACEQATILEENARLKKELAKFTTTKNKMGLDDLLSKQRSNNKKHGLGYAPKPYKKNNYKKEKPAQEKNKKVTNDGKASKGKATNGDRTGPNNHYALFIDYYGDVYANYVGPRVFLRRSKMVFDSGCTNHMTGGRGVLDQFIEDVNKKSSITFGDNSKGKVLGSDNLKLVLVGYVENNLYVVDLSKESPSPSTFLMAAKHDEDRVCSACVAGKQLKKRHPIKSIVTTSRPLELLHLDLFGPSHYDTLGGRNYGLVIVDDYSRYSWVFLLKSKDETHREFIIFAKKAQRMYESEIKAIRTDNGTEFKNYTMQEFVDDEGIKHEFSAPYTPQQNGVVERKNRTIIEMARTMLSEFNSPHNFWGEAISTAVHYSNRLFLRPLHNKTPYELLTGNKPNVMYIRVFGCKCLVKNNKGKLGKFETRTIEGTFVGYAENSHAYRYYNKSTGAIEVSCDVVFLEDNGSQVEQVVPCNAGDDDPSNAIKLMGIGHIQPTEVHTDDQSDEIEVSSSAQVEPSSTQAEPSSATREPSLLWVYFMGVPSTVPRSGKPGWPIDGDGGMRPIGRPSCCRSRWMKSSPRTRSRIHQTDIGCRIRPGPSGVAGSGATRDGGSDSDFVPPETIRGKGPMAETGGSHGVVRTKRKAKRKKASSSRHGSEEDAYAEFAHEVEHHDPNYVPITDLKTCELKVWTNLRQDNPYLNDEQPFTKYKRFWTKAQFVMWEQFYEPAVPEPAVKPRRLNVEFHNVYKHDDFKYVDMALKKMNMWTLVTLEQDYIPDQVSQFLCITFFHSNPQRHITFMAGTTPCTISYDQFQTALGY
ncbi:hypothetical protein QYE76_017663 [Lolium multiflorum]|uniref:Integrase catalytic domain-containing protein n=1 Tax=Lolium multiflorum TaxID=4521 RepID=A0AAD8PJ74_LOLMU|nr:hypothetical protein QYE76_017663 [Lolium multiflorum]